MFRISQTKVRSWISFLAIEGFKVRQWLGSNCVPKRLAGFPWIKVGKKGRTEAATAV